jgi:8-oxo-dGTP pyrophosphatase MutT (NUDIX family)
MGIQVCNASSTAKFHKEKMPALVQTIKRLAFKVIAKSAIAIYSRFPIFGDLRAAVAVMRQNGLILVIDRNDGRGFSFPGGLTHRGESAENSMRREVKEETGLEVDQARLLFEYRAISDVPCVVTVYEVTAVGTLSESWEGTPRWLPLTEVTSRILSSQAEIIRRISS